MLTVLITGFGPFPGVPFNPTAALARRLAQRRRPALADVTRVAHVFRTSYGAVDSELPELLARHQPDLVLLFGVATRTRHLRIETQAVNRRSALFPDADGGLPAGLAISAGAPGSIASRAPHRRLLCAARIARIEVRLSRDAGRYLCNFAYWRALEATSRSNSRPLAQFIHVPKIRREPIPRERLKRRPATLPDLVRAGEAMLVALVASARGAEQLSCKRPATPCTRHLCPIAAQREWRET